MDNGSSSLVAALVDVGNIDTVYRDVYLDRARALLAPVLSLEEFHRLEQQRAALVDLPPTIGRALEKSNWSLVKELSQRAQELKQTIDDKRTVLDAARSVYDVRDVRLDPFSPGLQSFTRIPPRELAKLQARVVEQLGVLERADAPWNAFYATRRAAFQARSQPASEELAADAGSVSAADPREAAGQALRAGDMKRLVELADRLIAGETPSRPASSHAVTVGSAPMPGESGQEVRPVAYAGETLARARQLGLALRHLEPRLDLASLRRYAWTPSSDEADHSAAVARLPLPPGSPEGLRDGLAMFAIHPLVNSGGARHLPTLVAEDVLVEDFPEPMDGQPSPVSELVKSLGLPGRRGLPRIAIEQALLVHGARVLEQDLGLDPRVFRLVCVPSDVYLRLGEAEGWGRQPFWTHFDEYLVMADVRLRALVGGDVRFGGLYDLVGVGRAYDSDRMVGRFAVVQRARMVAW
jgi:hypothetical protein